MVSLAQLSPSLLFYLIIFISGPAVNYTRFSIEVSYFLAAKSNQTNYWLKYFVEKQFHVQKRQKQPLVSIRCPVLLFLFWLPGVLTYFYPFFAILSFLVLLPVVLTYSYSYSAILSYLSFSFYQCTMVQICGSCEHFDF